MKSISKIISERDRFNEEGQQLRVTPDRPCRVPCPFECRLISPSSEYVADLLDVLWEYFDTVAFFLHDRYPRKVPRSQISKARREILDLADPPLFDGFLSPSWAASIVKQWKPVIYHRRDPFLFPPFFSVRFDSKSISYSIPRGAYRIMRCGLFFKPDHPGTFSGALSVSPGSGAVSQVTFSRVLPDYQRVSGVALVNREFDSTATAVTVEDRAGGDSYSTIVGAQYDFLKD